MLLLEGETTDRALLDRLGDWADHLAWVEFVRRYDPLIRRLCRAYRFDPETQEELCQRIWIELARRLRSYRFDPGRRFRLWLAHLCRSRAIDLWRQRRAEAARRGMALPAKDLASIADPTAEAFEFDEEPDAVRPELLLRADRVQQAVRARVDDRTWRVFWRIAVEEEPIRSVADSVGLSYAAAFAAQKRARRMLREEAARLGDDPGAEGPE
jgi:RNA polymerase sigma-70 factor (ECF subfamily)